MNIDLKLKKIKKFKCVCCDEPLDPIHADEKDSLDSLNIEGGNLLKCNGSYGSSYDTSVFYIAICDVCISNNPRNVIYAGNFMDSVNHKHPRYKEYKKDFKKQNPEG